MSSEPRRDDRRRDDRRGGQQGGKRFVRAKKSCRMCEEKIYYVDYKDVKFLASFIPERGKILPRRISGSCSPCQRVLARAIKRARNAALLPFATD